MQNAERLLAQADDVCFERIVRGIGCFTLRPLRPSEDAELVHEWVTQERARFWNMIDKTRGEIETFYRTLMNSGHATALIGLLDDKPIFLVESYDPAHDQVGRHYPVRPGDRGMHFLVGPAQRRIAGFSHAVIATIMEFLFADPTVGRVVVEPDTRNEKIHVLNRKVGFVYEGEIALKEKTARLAFCTRDQYAATLGRAAR